MMSPYDAAKLVKKAVPDRTPTYVCDYDKDLYVVTALKNPRVRDMNDPFWSVNKRTGVVLEFSSAENMDKFTEAMNRRGHEIR